MHKKTRKQNFKLILRVTLVLKIFFNLTLWAQELPPIENFSPQQYNALNQNWSIDQSANQVIYLANNKGLLFYNGTEWKLYPTPNETIMRSVKVVGDKIYTGCYMEFGYWQKNNFGSLEYHSLTKKTNQKMLKALTHKG